jgi:hypothetical protein
MIMRRAKQTPALTRCKQAGQTTRASRNGRFEPGVMLTAAVALSLLTACATTEAPLGNYVWTHSRPARELQDASGNTETLQAAKNHCIGIMQKITLPPDACILPPGRTCTGSEYATGACPPLQPPDPECNNQDQEAAFDKREDAFTRCMKGRGWTSQWVAEE